MTTLDLSTPCEIERLAALEGTPNSNSGSLRSVLEYYIPYFKSHPDTRVFDIEPAVADRYEGDFQGLCLYLMIPESLHWITMRVNGLGSTVQYPSDLLTLYSPAPEVYSVVVNTYLSNNRLRNKKK